MGASDLTLLSSRPMSSAKRLIWASRPSSLGSEVTGKEEETHTNVGQGQAGEGAPRTPPNAPRRATACSHQKARSSLVLWP